ncbi:MAG: UDP-2,4-diacetamido-2,4,6-trideoxy-beta-L-altropyranose hydrolase [Pelistega sp.]|nr:UDP-2,4-diacetamido-2,4,6-trideoxy-beta-L-altropyranose hydrolase [Pelistega sp.]
MRIGFRVDAAIHIGMGHLQRCLTLANYLTSVGHSCIFFCRNYGDDFYSDVVRCGHQLIIIGNSNYVKNIYKNNWLSVSLRTDLNDFIAQIKNTPIDACVIDHYGIDEQWEKEVQKHFKKIIVIDDLADRKHSCDILIDQNFLPNYAERYNKLVPRYTKKLLGPQFVLLRPEFKMLRLDKATKNDSSDLPKILINFGGAGRFELLSKVVKAVNLNHKFTFTIITGKLHKHEFQQLLHLANGRNVEIHEFTQNMARLMHESDFAVGACGSTVWERFCLGLNSALVILADNQTAVLNFLHSKNLIDSLGWYHNLTLDALSDFFNNLITDDDKYISRKLSIMKLIDGEGTRRVGEFILGELND